MPYDVTMEQPAITPPIAAEPGTQTGIAAPVAPHALAVPAVLAQLDVSPATGLTEDQVTQRLRAHGPNAILARRRVSVLALLAHQFKSPVVYLLAAAGALAFYFGEMEEGSAIAAVLSKTDQMSLPLQNHRPVTAS